MAVSSIKKLNQVKESDDSNASGSECEESDTQTEGNAGWADSIAKVLNTSKPKAKKTLVLSRAKKTKPGSEKTKPEDCGFEVEGEIKEEKPDTKELDEKLKQRKNISLALRVKPSWKDMERERALRKIATKGVVQLFNAVRIQQKDLQYQLEEAGPLDSRKEAVLKNINKRKFLDVLMSGSRAKSEGVDNPVKKEERNDEGSSSEEETEGGRKRKSEWSVLRDDFMTNKKIKHWDEDDDDNQSASNNSENDDSSDDVEAE